MKSIVSAEGQITLPARIREQLGLIAGTPVQFEVRQGGLFIRKGGGQHPVARVFGRLRLNAPVDDTVDAMRGPRPAAAKAPPRRRTSTRP
jgi:AbrB family looped-hinge helix DNA binding protein